jgi:hypothetical protein
MTSSLDSSKMFHTCEFEVSLSRCVEIRMLTKVFRYTQSKDWRHQGQPPNSHKKHQSQLQTASQRESQLRMHAQSVKEEKSDVMDDSHAVNALAAVHQSHVTTINTDSELFLPGSEYAATLKKLRVYNNSY